MKKLNKKGFTIVELVIVIAVIAILAAVLIPTFSSVVNKANESSALQAVRNAYTQCQITVTSAGLTLKDGTVFSDKNGDYFFKLEGNTIKSIKDTEVTDTEKKAYTELENGVRLYGVSVATSADGSMGSSGTKVMYFADTKGASSCSIKVYDEDGNEYYSESAAKEEGGGFCVGLRFSMFNTGNGAWDEGATVSSAAKSFTKAEDAKGWYSYTLTYTKGSTTYSFTGVFYYDGIA